MKVHPLIEAAYEQVKVLDRKDVFAFDKAEVLAGDFRDAVENIRSKARDRIWVSPLNNFGITLYLNMRSSELDFHLTSKGGSEESEGTFIGELNTLKGRGHPLVNRGFGPLPPVEFFETHPLFEPLMRERGWTAFEIREKLKKERDVGNIDPLTERLGDFVLREYYRFHRKAPQRRSQ